MKILVVDDHQLFIDGIWHVLQQMHPQPDITEASCAEQAIAQLESDESFDLVLIDLVMPGLNGLSVIQRMHEQGIWYPVVVVSGEECARTIKTALEMGILGFIPKSYSSQKMLAALACVLSGDTYIPPGIQKQIDTLKPRRTPLAGNITRRQRQVLELMARGYSNRQIATALFLTEHTVKAHVGSLLLELNAVNRTDCVHIARTRDLIER